MQVADTYVFHKKVDLSLFRDGFAIPVAHQKIFKQFDDRELKKGESKAIFLYLNGKTYPASLRNQTIGPKQQRSGEIVQVRYSYKSEIAQALRDIFHRSYVYCQFQNELKKRQKGTRERTEAFSEEILAGPSTLLEEPEPEYLAVYTTDRDDCYVLEPIFSEEVQFLKREMEGKSERQVEAELCYGAVDEGATIKLDERLIKIRKLNRKIGDGLKILYDYRCQICGKRAGEELGYPVAEAHHIDYYVNSMNNDAANLMILCPNHHSILHEANPIFDRKKKEFHYPNGRVQALALDRHL